MSALLLILTLAALFAGLALEARAIWIDAPRGDRDRRLGTWLVILSVLPTLIGAAEGFWQITRAYLEGDISEKATFLATGISEAINCSALIVAICAIYALAIGGTHVVKKLVQR